MLFIRKFLIVSCIASAIGVIFLLFDGKIVNLINDDYFEYDNVLKENDILDISNYVVALKKDFEYYQGVEVDDDVLFELYIPRISLKKFVYNIDSGKNNVNSNIELLRGSDEKFNLYFLASHSGGGKVSYFDDLVYLDIGDVIWLYKSDKNLGYVVDDIYFIERNGYFEVSYGCNGNRLFLITCSTKDVNKQLVVSAKMVYSS